MQYVLTTEYALILES